MVYTNGINILKYIPIVFMGVGIIKRDAFKCERCGHEWISDKFTPNNLPISCAKCKSPYWNIPKDKKK